MSKARIVLAAAALSIVCALAPGARGQSTNPLFELVNAGASNQASQPIFVADPGDGTGRLFVVERPGFIRIFANGTLQPEGAAFLDLSAVVNTTGEGGLTSMAFDPNFPSNGRVYVMYTRDGSGASVLESVVASYTVDGADPNQLDPASAKELLTLLAPPGAQFANHKGGQIQFGPDHMLYIGFGDGGSGDDPGCRAQTRNVFFGKLLRIDPNGTGFGVGGVGYGIPSDNPFPTGTDPNDPNDFRPEIFLLGLRNPWRFSFDRANGDLWIADVGQVTREEVDLLPAGTGAGDNLGWNVVEGTIARPGGNGMPIGACPAYVKAMNDPNADYTPPIFDYDHNGSGSSITGGYVYRGSLAPAWRGRYVYADYITKEVHALRDTGSGWESTLLSKSDLAGPASFGEGSDGELYAADLNTGWIYRLRLDRLAAGKSDAACVTKLNQGFGKLAALQAKLIGACVARTAKGKGDGDIEACSADDPKLKKATDKTLAAEAKQCKTPPAFGYTSANSGNAASTEAETALAHDVFGDDLDAAIALKSEDKNTAACQKAVLAGLASCQKTRRAEFLSCKKVGLKKGTLQSSEQLAGCLVPGAKSKVPKLCDATTGKLATKTIEKSCTARSVDLSNAFPGCATDDPAALAACLATAGCVRNCEMYDGADGLGADCDALCE